MLRKSGGFSLVEMAVLLVIFGGLAAASTMLGSKWVEGTEVQTTRSNIETIEKAIDAYVRLNRRLPCPAPETVSSSSSDFGKEAEGLGDCTAGTDDAESASTDTRKGVVPFKTLGIGKSLAYDAWGNRLSYYVDKRMTVENAVDLYPVNSVIPGDIVVQDLTLASNRTTKAVFALVSHGARAHGARSRTGTLLTADNPHSGELENADVNAAGASTGLDNTLVQAMVSGSFDDIVSYKLRSQLASSGVNGGPESCDADASVTWTQGAANCAGGHGELADGESVQVVDSTGPDSGTVIVVCDRGTVTQLSPVCTTAPANCTAQAVNWTVNNGSGNRNCSSSVGALTHSQYQDLTDSSGATIGAARFTCNSGTVTVEPGASCATECSAATVNWTQGANNCTGSVAVVAHGANALVSDALNLPTDQTSGNVTVTCNDGSFSQSAISCTYTNNGCTAGTRNWSVDNGNGARNCTGSIGALAHGGSSAVVDSILGTPSNGSGTANYTCSDGTLTEGAKTCRSQCVAGTANWTVGSSSCSQTYSLMDDGTNAAVSDATGPDTGSVTLSCADGVVSQSAATCSTTASCSSGSADALRFRSANSARMSKTFAAAGNRRAWTWSGWVKRSKLGAPQSIFIAHNGVNNTQNSALSFTSDDRIQFSDHDGVGTWYYRVFTANQFRDASTWMHIVAVIDTNNTTASDRQRLFVNGVRVSTFDPSNPLVNASSGYQTMFNAAYPHHIGWHPFAGNYFDGYMDKVHFVDGQALEPTAFGELNTNGQWIPKAYAGTYGTNGFRLDFDNATTTATLGNDTSGIGNNFTATNFSVASDSTRDSVADHPGTNYATWNSIDANLVTTSNGNLTADTPAFSNQIRATIGMASGKYYWEVTPTSVNGQAVCPGIVSEKGPNTLWLGWDIYGWCYNGNTGQIFNNTTNTAFSVGFTQNDVIGVAFDADTGKLWFAKNGTWGASGNPGAGTNPARTLPTGEVYFPALGDSSNGSATTSTVNFGQQPFVYTPPSGFKTLTASNLPTPTIAKPSEHFDAITYRGNGGGGQIGQIARDSSSYQLERSLRFRPSASPSLQKTPASAGSASWTWSGWVKRGSLGSQPLMVAGSPGGVYYISLLQINSSDQIAYHEGTNTNSLIPRGFGYHASARTLKDTSRWYHIVVNSSTPGTYQLWVDGVQESFPLASSAYAGGGYMGYWNYFGKNVQHNICGGFNQNGVSYCDGYMADVHFVDGQALPPSNFGEFDTKGHWQPKAYSGTYGTNGFRLDFNDNSSVSNLGKDVSGNNNHFTATNFSLASGYTNDSLFDVPTSWDDTGGGGTVVLAPTTDTTNNSGITVAADGLTMTGSGGAGDFAVRAVTPITGKKYFEYTVGASVAGVGGVVAGIVLDNYNLYDTNQHAGQPQVWGINMNGYKSHTSYSAFEAPFAAGDVVMIAVDKSAGKIWFGKNGSWLPSGFGAGDPATGTNPVFNDIGAGQVVMPYFYDGSFAVTASGKFNFGATAFAYSPPAGFEGMQQPTGNGRGNFPTINPLDQRGHGPTVSGGNLDFNIGRDVYVYTNTNVPQTGKWYWEVDLSAAGYDALCGVSHNNWAGASGPYTQGGGTNYVYPIDASWFSPPAGAPYMADGTCGVAVDMDNDKMWVSINGQWFFGGNPNTGANALNRLSGSAGWSLKGKRFVPAVGNLSPIGAPSNTIGSFNFGQRPFSYGPPTGFRAMNSQNMGTSVKFVGKPDLVWLKSRTAAADHALYDAQRGIKKDLASNTTAAETTQEGGVVQFNDDGVLIGDLAKINTKPVVNYNNQNNVGWMWNEDPAAGFDIVNYTGTGATRTVSHGLGKVPAMVIFKNRSNSGMPWVVYHKNADTNPATGYLLLNATDAFNPSSTLMNDTMPTTTQITLGSSGAVNQSGDNFSAYAFAEIPGFSKFGSYKGNGSTDGPFVYTGFKPRWIMIKHAAGALSSSSNANWCIIDTERNTTNPAQNCLWANTTNADVNYPSGTIDVLSNGFKVRQAPSDMLNYGSSTTYIYAAFAEQPFVASGSSSTTSCGCALPWGGSIASGGTVTAYQNASEACGGSCTSETRTCTNGVLSGSYTNQSCSVSACGNCAAGTANWTVGAKSCTASVGALNHGNNTTATDSTGPDEGTATVTCNNGAYNYTSTVCDDADYGFCGLSIRNGGSHVSHYYNGSSANMDVACNGVNPASSCPVGYKQLSYMATANAADSMADLFYTCVKQGNVSAGELSGSFCGGGVSNSGSHNHHMIDGSFTGASVTCGGADPLNTACPAGFNRFDIGTIGNNADSIADHVLGCVKSSGSSMSAAPTGSWCGLSLSNAGSHNSVSWLSGANVNCEGNNPAASCPAGFIRAQIAARAFAADSIVDSAFTCVKVPADTTPDAFSFTDVTGQALNTLITSNTITINGINAGTAVSVSGAGSPQISINGGAWGTSGTITNGQTLAVRLTSANAFSTARTATVDVGGVTDVWSVTTRAANNCTGTPWGTVNHSNSVTAWNTTASCGGCASQTRTCADGTLSGTYTATSCNNASCSTCAGGYVYDGSCCHTVGASAHGTVIDANPYDNAGGACGGGNYAGFGTLTCNNGTWGVSSSACWFTGGDGACFTKGTRVLMADGSTKPIETVKIGDEVKGRSGTNRVIGLKPTRAGDRAIYTINGVLKTTADHPALTDKGWAVISRELYAERYYGREMPVVIDAKGTTVQRALTATAPSQIHEYGVGDQIAFGESGFVAIESITRENVAADTPLFTLELDGDGTMQLEGGYIYTGLGIRSVK